MVAGASGVAGGAGVGAAVAAETGVVGAVAVDEVAGAMLPARWRISVEHPPARGAVRGAVCGTSVEAWNIAVRTRGVFTHRDDFGKPACVERGLVRTANQPFSVNYGNCRPAHVVPSGSSGCITGENGLADSASRDPQGGAGEKDVLKAVVTRHEFHGEPVPARLHLISDRVASVPPTLKI